jgi:hypothetical protein
MPSEHGRRFDEYQDFEGLQAVNIAGRGLALADLVCGEWQHFHPCAGRLDGCLSLREAVEVKTVAFVGPRNLLPFGAISRDSDTVTYCAAHSA